MKLKSSKAEVMKQCKKYFRISFNTLVKEYNSLFCLCLEVSEVNEIQMGCI